MYNSFLNTYVSISLMAVDFFFCLYTHIGDIFHLNEFNWSDSELKIYRLDNWFQIKFYQNIFSYADWLTHMEMPMIHARIESRQFPYRWRLFSKPAAKKILIKNQRRKNGWVSNSAHTRENQTRQRLNVCACVFFFVLFMWYRPSANPTEQSNHEKSQQDIWQ